MSDSAAQQTGPDAAIRIGHETGPGAATQLLPRRVLNDVAVDQMRQTVVIGSQPETEPQTTAVVAGDGVRKAARYGRDGAKLPVVEHRKTASSRDPDTTALILKQRLDGIVGQTRIDSPPINRRSPV